MGPFLVCRRRRPGPRRSRHREHRDARALARSRRRRSVGRAPEGVTALEVSAGSVGERSPGSRPATSCSRSTERRCARPPTSSSTSTRNRRVRGSRTRCFALGEQRALDVSLASISPRGSMYFVLAGVGLFTLLVGASVRLRRPRDQATLHFFWLCVAFLALSRSRSTVPSTVWTGSSTGATPSRWRCCRPCCCTSRWCFPSDRPGASRPRTDVRVLPLVYVSALALSARTDHRRRPRRGGWSGALACARSARSGRAPVPLSVLPRRVAVLTRGLREITSLTAQRQLRWLAWGTVARRRPLRARICAAVGASAPIRRFALQLTASAARPRAARLRVGDRPRTGCGTSK